jgi:hypothetical protein
MLSIFPEHHPEKWKPVFRKDHAQTKIQGADCQKCDPKASTGRQPEPQAKGDDGNRADPTEPKCEKPQQALRQRRRLWLAGRQW